MLDYLIIILLVLLSAIILYMVARMGKMTAQLRRLEWGEGGDESAERLRRELLETQRGQRQELTASTQAMTRSLSEQLTAQTKQLENRLQTLTMENEQRLRQLYEGMGEVRTLAAGIGDLKKILGNVKTRGILGEIQLRAILEEILAPQQYQANVMTKAGSRAVVEFALKIPTDEGDTIWLPIDAKFPADAYEALRDAADSGDTAAIQAASAVLQSRVKAAAKDIRDKYLDPPNTTDFAVMFLPFEGLYAEVIHSGLLETLQRDYHVVVAGPSTTAALLSSLQTGFRAMAIQKRSTEVWNVLGAVKTEFDRFAEALAITQQRLSQTEQDLERLVGVRTRAVQKRLNGLMED